MVCNRRRCGYGLNTTGVSIMAIGYVNFRASRVAVGFANLAATTTTQTAIPDTTWTAGYRAGNLPSGSEGNTGGGWVQSSGAAAWAVEDVSREGHFVSTGVSPALLDISGFTPGESIRVTCYSRFETSAGRISRWIVNASLPQDLACYDTTAGTPNLTNVVVFDTVADGGGIVTVSHSNAPSSSLTGRSMGLKIEQIAGADTTAPTFTTSPAVSATSETGHTIASTLNETGTLYGVRLASGATAPSSAQVKAGQNNTGAAALEAVSVAATAATNANLVFSTGAASTAYAYYIVAEDDETTPNLQAIPTLVSATTAATAVPGIGQLTVQFEGVAINVADWHIITRLAADQSILYNQTGQSSDASGNIAAFATTSGSVGDPVRVEGLSAADAYSFVIEQNLGNIA
jgi:hypothetical protein